MLDGHRIGVRVKRHRDLRHDKILDFIETLPKDENGEIMKTVLSNHVFNALFLYARLLKGEISISDNGTTDILTSLQMQSSVPATSTATTANIMAPKVEHIAETQHIQSAPLEESIQPVAIPVKVEGSNVNTNLNLSSNDDLNNKNSHVNSEKEESIRKDRPRFGKTLSRG